jgi:hypothetical protein
MTMASRCCLSREGAQGPGAPAAACEESARPLVGADATPSGASTTAGRLHRSRSHAATMTPIPSGGYVKAGYPPTWIEKHHLVHLSECLSNFPKRIERLLSLPAPDDGSEPLRSARRVLQRPNRKLSPAEIDQLVADYQTGLCLTELGERYGLHRQTAKAHLERCGVTVRSELPALSEEQVAHAVRLYADGWGLNPVAAQLSVAPNTVKRALLARGVRLRPRGFAGPRPA